jgi:sulfate adenylyltransferase
MRPGGTICVVPEPSPPPTPQWTPTQRELDDLDVLVSHALGPDVTGFVDPSENGALPLTLTVPAETAALAEAAGALELIDPEGAPLAILTPAGRYGAAGDRVGLVGAVAPLAHNEFGAFRRLHRSPEQVHAHQPRESILAVPVTRPLTAGDVDTISQAAQSAGRRPVLLALVGAGSPESITGPALIRATLEAAQLMQPAAVVAAVSLADHGDAARDRLHTAVADAYGGATLTLPAGETGVFPPAIEAIVARERPPRDRQGAVIFFTGLSGSGKSTLARALVDKILEQGERTVTSLDGDVVRHHLSKGLGFSREDRETNILRIGFVAAEIARHGGLAICSPIAPFESTRAAVREMVEQARGGFVLVHVATPLEECERRDRKGLYARARRGEIPDFTGISSPYEEPRDAVKIDTTNRDIAECLEELVQALVAQGWLHA